MAEWLVTVMVEGADSDEVHDIVADWVLSPGAYITSINSAQPIQVLAAPHMVAEDGTVGPMIKKAAQPSVIPVDPTAMAPPAPPGATAIPPTQPEPEPELTAFFTVDPNPAKLPGGVMAKVLVAFDGSESIGDSLWYVWDYGDGTIDNMTGAPHVSHEYSKRGSYDVTLTVNEPPGELGLPTPTDSTTLTVVIE